MITSKEESVGKKEYIGMTADTFKKRYGNHKTSFNDLRYENETELSKYVWKLKRAGKNYDIKWSILKRASSYSPGGKHSHLLLFTIVPTSGGKRFKKKIKTMHKMSSRGKVPRGKIQKLARPTSTRVSRTG